MSNNSDMIRMLRLVEGQQFAGLPEQQPGDQVRGTERAVKKGDQHPFHNRLVGEEISLEDKLAKKYQDMKDLHGKEVSEMDKSQTPPGRDGDPRPGPERVATPITPEKMVNHALDTLSKSMAKKDDKKKDVSEEQINEYVPGDLGVYIAAAFAAGKAGEAAYDWAKQKWKEHQLKNSAKGSNYSMAEGANRVDSIVTDAVKFMKGSTVSDAVLALKRVLGDRAYNERRGFYSFYVDQILDMYNQQGLAEGNMPQSVIRSKQKYADMTDQEFHAAHKNKSAEELQAMAQRHGYGKGSNHYVAKHKKGATVTEGQEEIEYICSGCSGSGEGPHEGTTCRTCHGSGVEMGYADEPAHDHDHEEELDELSINTLNRVHGAAVRDADNYTRDGDEVRAQKRYDLAGRASNQAELKKRAAGLPPSGQHELDEDQNENPMYDAALRRIMMRHMDLIEKYGLDRLLDAVRDVTDSMHYGPDDEIGTSDVSAVMVNVMNQLKSSDHTIDEENIPAGNINASGSPTVSSGPAPVSAGGTAPTTPSSTAPAPAATTAPTPPGQQPPMTPEELAALNKIKANAGLKAQYDRLMQQAH